MSKTPSDRFATAADFADDLRRFADGRVIRSRRPGVIERAMKWSRRHRSATVALGLAALLAVTVSGALWAAASIRAERQAALIGKAYEQLAFVNYRDVDVLADDLQRIDRIAAGNPQAQRVMGLAELASGNLDEAIAHLHAARDAMPEDAATGYLLSWAYAKAGDTESSARVFAGAEELGAPAHADGWFFRGLAAHRADPDLAVESYRQASRLRTQTHGFYPQAVLHLARARNQQMYAQRSLEFFHDADVTLRQLIEHEAYGAYPYYLLSITHRLAAELYRGSEGTRDDALVEEHFAEALRLARAGRQVEPDNDRPVTAEAECLESMGRYEEAIAARTLAIDIASKSIAIWEGLHYRWRLRYWTGDYDGALDDLGRCAAFDPGNRFYEVVYPTLVMAESDGLDAAKALARSLGERGDASLMDRLWSASTLRWLGASDEAREVLNGVRFDPDADPAAWERFLHGLMTGKRSLDELDTMVASSPSRWRLQGEACFHDAARLVSAGKREKALELFRRAYRSFDSEQGYTYHAKVILKRVAEGASWPWWIDE
jgi:tetratricopeptide (TPR) repeat protein